MNSTTHNLATQGQRAAFTLTELLVVIAIILVITIGALPAVLGGLRDRKFSDAVRTVQAAFAGARDRAITSGQVRGLRFLRDGDDSTDPSDLSVWEVSRILYVGVPEPYSVGTVNNTVGSGGVNVIRVDALSVDPAWDLVDPGKDNTPGTIDDIPRVDAPRESALASDVRFFESYIRFNQAGPLYRILQVNDQTLNAARATLTIATTPPISAALPAGFPQPPFPPPPPTLPPGTRYQIFGPAVPLANDPILLPDGAVIDLRTPNIPVAAGRTDLELLRLPRSLRIPNQVPLTRAVLGPDLRLGTPDDPSPFPAPATWPRLDILFGPEGRITGRAATADVIHLWIGERADRAGIGPDNVGGTIDDVPTARLHKLVSLVVGSGMLQVEDSPDSVGDPNSTPAYGAVYGRAEQEVGVSVLNVP
jgi:prepilin-type N-terminal cleavage/methylation domain-containing protein